jgi:dihydrofolate reductase
MDEHGAIGRAGGLPWHLPDDLKRFKALTLGKPILMGRRTWDSICRPLPGRRSIVVTRQAGLAVPAEVTVAGSIGEAIAAAGDVPEACVIGGAEIYRAALPLTDVLHVTRVHAVVEADTHFPPIDPRQWLEVSREEHPADARHAYAFAFVEMRRRG